MAEGTARDAAAQRARYLRKLKRRLGAANLAAYLRAGGIQLLWLVVVAAGAGVPLNDSLEGPDWVGPVLGFVIVVSAGIERIFRRTTVAATASDQLRRRLGQERRLYQVRGGDYLESARPFDLLVQRSEEAFAQYDELMVDYGRTIVTPSK